jgi:hypothetical protein
MFVAYKLTWQRTQKSLIISLPKHKHKHCQNLEEYCSVFFFYLGTHFKNMTISPYVSRVIFRNSFRYQNLQILKSLIFSYNFIISRLLIIANAIQRFAILNFLGNVHKKQDCTCSVQLHLFFWIFFEVGWMHGCENFRYVSWLCTPLGNGVILYLLLVNSSFFLLI